MSTYITYNEKKKRNNFNFICILFLDKATIKTDAKMIMNKNITIGANLPSAVRTLKKSREIKNTIAVIKLILLKL